jgi:hypothetical protein
MDAPAITVAVAVVTVLAVALALCARYDWWPLHRNLENYGKLAMLAVATTALTAVGVFWLIRTGLFVTKRRKFSWPIAALPAIVAVGAVVAFVPGPDTFDDERVQFDRIAQQTISDPDKMVENVKIGSFDVTAIQREDGGVYFYDADSPAETLAGWVYSPNTRPSYYGFSKLKSIGGGWYEFRASL